MLISHEASLPFSTLYILFGCLECIFVPREILLFYYAIYTIPKHSNKVYLGQIFTKSFRSFDYIVIDLILNFLSSRIIIFNKGQVLFGRKPLCLSKRQILVFIKQFFPKSFSFFCVVFIKIP